MLSNISRQMKYPSSSHEDEGTLDLVDDDFDCRKNFLEICGVDFAKIYQRLCKDF